MPSPAPSSHLPSPPVTTRSFALSVDTWAVLLSLGLALLVRSGIIKTVAW